VTPSDGGVASLPDLVGRRGRARRRRAAWLAVALGAALGACAGCASTPIGPTYTQDELRAACERQRGWWRPDGLIGGFCEFRAAS
jgi:hypothetical protein